MDPITVSVVSALSAGALAVGREFATSAIKDSYEALKKFVLARFSHAKPFVEAVEKDPSSMPEQQVLAKQLTGVGESDEVKHLVEQLTTALRQEPRAAAVFDFDTLKAVGSFELNDIDHAGTVLRAREATFEKDFKASGIRLAASPQSEKKKSDRRLI